MEKTIFLTFDMDWASDEVLHDFYNLLCALDVCGTLNVTHHTTLLDMFRKENRLELGIHPNFNMLLEGTVKGESYEDVIDELQVIVPEAVTCRAHALTNSSKIKMKYVQCGVKYNLDMFYPPQKGNQVTYFKNAWGGVKYPFYLKMIYI